MGSNGNDRAQLVHEARKTIKRMRALARLLRTEIGESEFQRVNGSLREVGQRLAVARDAAVQVATLSALRERHSDELAGAGVDDLLARLRREQLRPDAGEPDSDVLGAVAQMRRELLRWSVLRHESGALTDGLRSIYRSGRRRYRRARQGHGRDPEAMHDWRKRAKSLYYALDMLDGERVKEVAKSTRMAELVGDVLGQEHDLWMLAERLRIDEALPTADRAVLLELIERRRERLRARALELGKRLYERKPRRFAARTRSALAHRS